MRIQRDMLTHRLMNEGPPLFQEEIVYATRRGTRLLNMSDFRDEAHSSSWDHSAFVRTYALYLDQRLEMMLFDRKSSLGGAGAGSGGSGVVVVVEVLLMIGLVGETISGRRLMSMNQEGLEGKAGTGIMG